MHHAGFNEFKFDQSRQRGQRRSGILCSRRELEAASIDAGVGGEKGAAVSAPRQRDLAGAVTGHVERRHAVREIRTVAILDQPIDLARFDLTGAFPQHFDQKPVAHHARGSHRPHRRAGFDPRRVDRMCPFDLLPAG
ncbi:hypothetical protein GCM10007897_11370 [Sphingobium jiangsuense]|nr:hypothetical protein GCM10007897_11370 [Sphingobium jiangsuense]